MLVERRYDRDRALTYAREWAMSRNPLFIDYTGFGGDCTNFVSQCLFAGSCRMNFTPVFGWYYLDADSRTASWTGVQYFYNFLTSNRGEGPFGVETDETNLRVGDVVQLQNEGGAYYHTLLVSGIDPEEYTGFAFGVGLERIALLKYEIDDMRELYKNDIRFLKQF